MKHNVSTHRGLVVVLFAAYLALLTWAVVWKFGAPYVGSASGLPIKVVPFVPTEDAGGSAPLEVIANVAMFVPFGVYLRLIAPTQSWWIAASIVASASVSFEAAQYLLATGIADVSDVIANTTGGLIGISVVQRFTSARTVVGTARAFAIAATIGVIALAAFLASSRNFMPPRDVGPLGCARANSDIPRPAMHARECGFDDRGTVPSANRQW